jgi:3-dehydroquinate synthase
MTWRRRLERTGRISLIEVEAGVLSTLSTHAREAGKKGSRLFVITDHNVAAAWLDAVRSLLRSVGCGHEVLLIPAGETSKCMDGLQTCWDWLAESGCRRRDVVVALGGGVVGDLAGFAAATFQRGVSLWQIPTSLLAQVDSSVGGKTAINLAAGKNLVGAFYQPDLVLVDPLTLATLPQPEFVSGLGEVVKYGLLDGDLFVHLEKNVDLILERDSEVMAGLVRTCIAYKAAVVEDDELDLGRRAVLNLGHTTAHALEVTTGYGTIAHGEAVGLGLLVALAVSERLLALDPGLRPRLRSLLERWGMATTVELPDARTLVEAAHRDKKVDASRLNFVGLRALGDPLWGLDVPDDILQDALEVIRR